TDHKAGMKGAEATIDGAYDTTAYTASYTPTDGGEPVEDHKWVIHEELENPDEAPLEAGTEVTMNATRMEVMDSATAEIDGASEIVVYMVSYTSTDDNEEVSNHKWVTEDELSPVEYLLKRQIQNCICLFYWCYILPDRNMENNINKNIINAT